MAPPGLPQLAVELGSLTFARVTALRCGKGDDAHDLLRGDDDFDYDHEQPFFYGFAVSVDTGTSVWFKKSTHVSQRSGMHVGPVTLNPSVRARTDLPRHRSIVVGRTTRSARGPMFEWWCHEAEPVMALARAVRTGRVRPTQYHELRLPPSLHPTPDDLWCLARMVVCAHHAILVDKRAYHPVRRDAHTRARGLEIRSSPAEFVWMVAFLVREPCLVDQSGLKSKNPWTRERLEHALLQ